MQNLKSSNAKRRKLLYYLYYTPLVYFFPTVISRLSLKSILRNNPDKEHVQKRIRYYFKKTSNFEVSKNGKNLSELSWNQFFTAFDVEGAMVGRLFGTPVGKNEPQQGQDQGQDHL